MKVTDRDGLEVSIGPSQQERFWRRVRSTHRSLSVNNQSARGQNDVQDQLQLCLSCQRMFRSVNDLDSDDEYYYDEEVEDEVRSRNHPNSRPFHETDDWKFHSRGIHHSRARDCKAAADAGCPICYIVWTKASDHGKIDLLHLRGLKSRFTGFWVKKKIENPHESLQRFPAETIVITILTHPIAKARKLDSPHYLEANCEIYFVLDSLEGGQPSSCASEAFLILTRSSKHCR
jgi:hypothetical protein